MDQLQLDFTPGASARPPAGWVPDSPPDLSGVRDVAVDFETTGLKWWSGDRPVGVAVAWVDEALARRVSARGPVPKECVRKVYLPFGHRGGGNLDEGAVCRWMRGELRNKRHVNLNNKFDAHMSLAVDVDLEALGVEAVDVGHHAALLNDHRTHYSLDAVARDLVGEGKVKGLNPKLIAEYPAWDVEAYAEQDASLAVRIQSVTEPMLAEQGLTDVAALESAALWPTVEMERRAMRVDAELLTRWYRESEQEHLKLLWDIYRASGMKVRPDSTEDLEELVLRRKLNVRKFTPTGRPSFDDSVMEELAERDPVMAMVRRDKKLSSLRSKYLAKYWLGGGQTGTLRFSLHQLRADDGGTISGRYSGTGVDRDASEGFNPQQVMAVEKQLDQFGDRYVIRKLFVPAPGKLFLSADAKQIEFRLFAHYAKSQALLDAYARDKDTNFHKLVAAMVLELGCTLTYKQVKNLNFAKLYGAGLTKVSAMLGVSEGEARQFVAQYDKAFPEASRLLSEAARVAAKRGYVKTVLGRRTRFPDRQRLHKALNAVIQGGAADIMKRKLVELHAERKWTGMDLRVTVHDEVCGDVPDEESARRVREVLDRQSFDLRVPILWDVRTGDNWAACK